MQSDNEATESSFTSFKHIEQFGTAIFDVNTMQLLIDFLGESVVFGFDDGKEAFGLNIKSRLSQVKLVPLDKIVLLCNGRPVNNSDVLGGHTTIFLRAMIKGGLSGGKGGFGAMLRSLAKKAGGKKTTDFGACRDLSGRRLRHVNDEIILQKWKEAKDRGEEFDVEQNTESGLDMWFMNTPSWVDGFKGRREYRKKFMKPRIKTQLCIDWLRARKERDPPSSAPVHWGCPRGSRCEYAHGETELRGEALETILAERQEVRKSESAALRDQYLKPVLQGEGEGDDSMAAAVLIGLMAAKKKKAGQSISTSKTSVGKEVPVAIAVDVSTSVSISSGNKSQQLKQSLTNEVDVLCPDATPDESQDSGDCSWIEVLAGQVVSSEEGDIRCMPGGGFGTVSCKSATVSNGRYGYEITVVTGGLVQIGWANKTFHCDATAGDGDGVGDDSDSWAYDGARQRKWHGSDTSFGEVWTVGDVVGCWVEIGTATADPSSSVVITMSYSLNGRDLGAAFSFSVNKEKDGSGGGSGGIGCLYPALSLDEQETILLNIGQCPFKFPKENFLPIREAIAETTSKTKTETEANTNPPPKQNTTATTPTVTDTDTTTTDTVTSALDPEPLAAVATTPIPTSFSEIDIDSDVFAGDAGPESPAFTALEALGRSHLKAELQRRSMKTGGTLQEMVKRLLAARKVTSVVRKRKSGRN
eukprot:gene8226-16914_t